MFRAIILGAPASGKGTISGRIIKHFDIFHLSTGDMLRKEMKKSTKLGKEAKAYVEHGKLVPDSLIFELLCSELGKLSEKNWLLDGFPRTKVQAETLHEMVKINLAINLVVPFDVIVDRAKGRWIHVPSGRVYNDNFNAPKVHGKDDVTGEPLEQREDDKPQAVRKRLEIYDELIHPVLDFYRDKNVLHDYPGNSSDEIWPKIRETLSRHIKPRG